MTFRKKLVCCSLLVMSLGKVSAQDSTRGPIREFHLALTDLSPLNIQIKYKVQLRQKMFFKVGLINLAYFNNYNNNAQGGTATRNVNYSAGALAGLEFRSNLYNRFAFFHGPNLSFSTVTYVVKTTPPFSGTQTRTSTTYTAGLPYTLGLQFHLRSNFYLAAEINPVLQYTHLGGTTRYDNISFIATNAGMLSLVYRL